jgi:hypothetical protein
MKLLERKFKKIGPRWEEPEKPIDISLTICLNISSQEKEVSRQIEDEFLIYIYVQNH